MLSSPPQRVPCRSTPPCRRFSTTRTPPATTTSFRCPNPSQPTDTVYTHREVAPVPENNSEYFGKWDHVMSKHRVTVDYFLYNHDIRAVPTTLTQRWSYAFYQTKQQNANINDTWTLSPNAVNQLYLSYTRQKGGRTNFPGQHHFRFRLRLRRPRYPGAPAVHGQ